MSEQQPTDGAPRPRAATRAARSVRAAIGRNPTTNRVYRTSVGVVGVSTVALGVALIPLPGPGSLIALGGLALLGTEFEGAKKTSTKMNAAARKALTQAKARRAAKAAASAATPTN